MGHRERERAPSQTRQFVTPRNGQGVQTPAGIPEPIPNAQALRIKNPLPAFNHKYVMLHCNGIKQAPC
jgi:hypothetical protein